MKRLRRFLLARQHIDSLRLALSPRAVRDGLARVSAGVTADVILEQAYDDAVRRIESQPEHFVDLAKRVLMWVGSAMRQLSVEELQHALATQPGNEFDDQGVIDAADLVSVCAGLVTLDDVTHVVRFVHSTTQEYFQRNPRIQGSWFPFAHAEMTAVCLAYLSNSSFATGPCKDEEAFETRLTSLALLNYACTFWPRHAQLAEHDEWEPTAIEILQNLDTVSAIIQVQYCAKFEVGRRLAGERYFRPIFINGPAEYGLSSLTAELLKSSLDPNRPNSFSRSPLQLAAATGHEQDVQHLIARRDVDVNCDKQRNGVIGSGTFEGSPLYLGKSRIVLRPDL